MLQQTQHTVTDFTNTTSWVFFLTVPRFPVVCLAHVSKTRECCCREMQPNTTLSNTVITRRCVSDPPRGVRRSTCCVNAWFSTKKLAVCRVGVCVWLGGVLRASPRVPRLGRRHTIRCSMSVSFVFQDQPFCANLHSRNSLLQRVSRCNVALALFLQSPNGQTTFVFDKHHMEFETLESKIVKEIMQIIPAEFKRKVNFLEVDPEKNPMFTGRQIMYWILLFFNINKTQGIL